MNGFFIGLDWQHQPIHDLDPRVMPVHGASQCAAGEVIVNQGVPNNKRRKCKDYCALRTTHRLSYD